jgi:hypothetical protein
VTDTIFQSPFSVTFFSFCHHFWHTPPPCGRRHWRLLAKKVTDTIFRHLFFFLSPFLAYPAALRAAALATAAKKGD